MIISHSVTVVKQLYAITCLFRDVNAPFIANKILVLRFRVRYSRNKIEMLIMQFLNYSLEMQKSANF